MTLGKALSCSMPQCPHEMRAFQTLSLLDQENLEKAPREMGGEWARPRASCPTLTRATRLAFVYASIRFHLNQHSSAKNKAWEPLCAHDI